jgi:hypothetical protein
VFRALKGQQEAYPELIHLTEELAKHTLARYGFLPGLPPAHARSCYRCKAEMRLGKDGQLRCKKKCGVHFRAEAAYTPLHNTGTSYLEYLRLAFCFSSQLRVDQTVLFSGVDDDRVHRMFACFRCVCAWYQLQEGRGVTFCEAEVDMDAAKTHVDRSSSSTHNTHTGRLFMMKERGSGKKKVVALRDLEVRKGTALPPESNKDIKSAIIDSMRPGSIAAADGGKAISSCVKKAAGGQIPLAIAVHSRKPRKQFTRLEKIPKSEISPALAAVLQKQKRWDPQSSSVRVTGGNQAAEGEWGCAKMLLKARGVHRGAATRHSSEHALCAIFLAHRPGLLSLGHAMRAFLQEHKDSVAPTKCWKHNGWHVSVVGDTKAEKPPACAAEPGEASSAVTGGTEATPPTIPPACAKATPPKVGVKRKRSKPQIGKKA